MFRLAQVTIGYIYNALAAAQVYEPNQSANRIGFVSSPFTYPLICIRNRKTKMHLLIVSQCVLVPPCVCVCVMSAINYLMAMAEP